MSKYDPILDDPNYWKYQGLVESFHKLLVCNKEYWENEELLISAIAHIARKTFDMGYGEAMIHYEPEKPLDGDKLLKKEKMVN